MTKAELFKKYSINDSHQTWDDKIDNWFSIEVYRLMHDGNLPPKDAIGVMWVCDFLDKQFDMVWWSENVIIKDSWGSFYLTAKRMVFRHADIILENLNNK